MTRLASRLSVLLRGALFLAGTAVQEAYCRNFNASGLIAFEEAWASENFTVFIKYVQVLFIITIPVLTNH